MAASTTPDELLAAINALTSATERLLAAQEAEAKNAERREKPAKGEPAHGGDGNTIGNLADAYRSVTSLPNAFRAVIRGDLIGAIRQLIGTGRAVARSVRPGTPKTKPTQSRLEIPRASRTRQVSKATRQAGKQAGRMAQPPKVPLPKQPKPPKLSKVQQAQQAFHNLFRSGPPPLPQGTPTASPAARSPAAATHMLPSAAARMPASNAASQAAQAAGGRSATVGAEAASGVGGGAARAGASMAGSGGAAAAAAAPAAAVVLTIGAYVAAAYAANEFRKAMDEATRRTIDHYRKLSEVSGAMAQVMANRDIREMLREREKGDRLAGVAGNLTDAEQRRNDAQKNLEIMWEELKGGFLTEYQKTMEAILVALNHMAEMLGYKPGTYVGGDGLGQMMTKIRDAERDREQKHRNNVDRAKQ